MRYLLLVCGALGLACSDTEPTEPAGPMALPGSRSTSFAPSASTTANGYVAIDLGTLGGEYSEGQAINDAGEVTGGSTTASGEGHAFRWEGGVMTDLGTLGGNSSQAAAINEVGQVTGVSTTASGEFHAFLWQDGVMTDLGTLGGSSTYGNALNEASQVAGTSAIASGEQHAFLWQRGVMTDLGTLSGNVSFGYDINEVGQVTGALGYAGRQTAFLWAGVMTELGTLGGDYSSGRAINDAGQVTGYSTTRLGHVHATLWQISTPVVQPVVQVQRIVDQVGQLQAAGTLGEGQANSLTQKLLRAIVVLSAEKTTPAVNLLNAFIHEVTALMAGSNPVLTPAQGQPLIDAANTVIAALST